MLKSTNLEEKTDDENEPLGADEGYFFPSNLAILIAQNEMLKNNLPSLIRTNQQTITDLLEGKRTPSVAMLVRLRKALDVPLDALLLWDLHLPENMERLEEQSKAQKTEMELAEIRATLATLMQEMEAMREVKKEVEELKQAKSEKENK